MNGDWKTRGQHVVLLTRQWEDDPPSYFTELGATLSPSIMRLMQMMMAFLYLKNKNSVQTGFKIDQRDHVCSCHR